MEDLSKELGLEGIPDTPSTPTVKGPVKTNTKSNSKTTKEDVLEAGVKKADEALKKAAANAALSATLETNKVLSEREADKTYILEKQRYMLNKCKADDNVKFVGNKLYAQYFGKVYTFLVNAIPVTVKFDGSEQEFPRFIRDIIERKITEVADSNTPKVVIEQRTDEGM